MLLVYDSAQIFLAYLKVFFQSSSHFFSFLSFWVRLLLAKNDMMIGLHAFYKQRVFWTPPQYCLTLSWIELQMLLRRCLIHIAIFVPGHILYLVYLCPCLGLGLLMSYPCDLFFMFILIFIVINYITSLKQAHLVFVQLLKFLILFLEDNIDEESE